MKRFIARLLVVLGLVGGVAVAVASPAQASWSDCSQLYVCGFYGYTGGTPVLFTVYRSPGTCYNLSAANNDQASSISNHLGNHHAIQPYRNSDCTGGHLATACCGSNPIPAGTNTSFVVGYAGEMSSVFFNTGCIPSPCPSAAGLRAEAGPLLTQRVESARAPIPGCQTIEMNDSVPPFPATVVWQPAELGHDYGRYRISSGCGQQLNARLLGIGPDSNQREAIIFMHIQREDGTWYRTGTVHARTGQGAVRVAGFLPVNRHFYLHCADYEREPQENQPCRLTFTF